MSQSDFIYAFLSVSSLLAVIFFWGRKGAAVRPSGLKLKGTESSQYFPEMPVDPAVLSDEVIQSQHPNGVRSLNVIFVWNGHPWDAHEVLGIPAGSSLDRAVLAHEELCNKTDKQSRPFFDAALGAIRTENRKKRYPA